MLKALGIKSNKDATRLTAESKLITYFLNFEDSEYAVELLTNFKKEYEKEIRKQERKADRKKKDIEKKKEFLLNNLHLTNSEQEEALKTPYHQLHKIKKENNIPLYSEVKDEIEKALAISYKDSEEFEKNISYENWKLKFLKIFTHLLLNLK